MLSRTFTYQPHVQVVCIHIIYIMHISMISSPCTGALYMCISSTRTYQFHSRRYRPNLQIIHTYMSSTRTYHPRVHNNIIHTYMPTAEFVHASPQLFCTSNHYQYEFIALSYSPPNSPLPPPPSTPPTTPHQSAPLARQSELSGCAHMCTRRILTYIQMDMYM